ncbi:MAG: hypothetical protein FJ255_07070 [Phycisphaerae bacterium]|nr:hypothetical protein [Phycisphaerae bacterium]
MGSHGWRLALGNVAATGWAGAMQVLGLAAVFTAPSRWPIFAPHLLLAGTVLVAGGHYVFLVLVADRVFPLASPRVTLPVEVAALAVFLIGMALLLGLMVTGV